MCTGKCSKVVAISLYVLALVSIICSIILLFPNFKSQYVSDDGKDGQPRLTPEVKYMGGLIGGGAMVSTFMSFLTLLLWSWRTPFPNPRLR